MCEIFDALSLKKKKTHLQYFLLFLCMLCVDNKIVRGLLEITVSYFQV